MPRTANRTRLRVQAGFPLLPHANLIARSIIHYFFATSTVPRRLVVSPKTLNVENNGRRRGATGTVPVRADSCFTKDERTSFCRGYSSISGYQTKHKGHWLTTKRSKPAYASHYRQFSSMKCHCNDMKKHQQHSNTRIAIFQFHFINKRIRKLYTGLKSMFIYFSKTSMLMM